MGAQWLFGARIEKNRVSDVTIYYYCFVGSGVGDPDGVLDVALKRLSGVAILRKCLLGASQLTLSHHASQVDAGILRIAHGVHAHCPVVGVALEDGVSQIGGEVGRNRGWLR